RRCRDLPDDVVPGVLLLLAALGLVDLVELGLIAEPSRLLGRPLLGPLEPQRVLLVHRAALTRQLPHQRPEPRGRDRRRPFRRRSAILNREKEQRRTGQRVDHDGLYVGRGTVDAARRSRRAERIPSPPCSSPANSPSPTPRPPTPSTSSRAPSASVS